MHTYTLICEGPCNPQLPALDAAIARMRDRLNSNNQRHVLPDLVDQCRLLVHTPHTQRYADYFRCAVCGTERRY